MFTDQLKAIDINYREKYLHKFGWKFKFRLCYNDLFTDYFMPITSESSIKCRHVSSNQLPVEMSSSIFQKQELRQSSWMLIGFYTECSLNIPFFSLNVIFLISARSTAEQAAI